MLGDEWLLTRIRNWQRLSILLLVLLVASWAYFLFFSADKTADIQKSALKANSQKVEVTEKDFDKQLADQSESRTASVQAPNNEETKLSKVNDKKKDSSLVESQKTKAVYQPKKREVEISTSNKSNLKESANDKGLKTVVPSKSQNPAIFLEDLPANIQSDFPSIELGSYVVSEDSSNSFVILDGGFYKVNQVIAPEMVLRDINTQHILVEFKGYFVKLPHKQ